MKQTFDRKLSGKYKPPPCSFNRVTINFTVTVQGRQFDRLGILYLDDVEIFRTSTAEPTQNGIVWTYVKEVQQYNALWKKDQKIIFDLPNIVNDIYTGPLSTSLTATFSTDPGALPAADDILAISSQKSNSDSPSAFGLPNERATVSLTFPRNVERAVISLSANGQQAEEFWYTNVYNADKHAFQDTTGELNGYSPFREVQLFIDGQLAGVSWPFPVVFTGGIVPGLWRPIAGIETFDLRQHEIDISPWLGLLCNGQPHEFEIKVAGLNDDKTLTDSVGWYWPVTGTAFLFRSNSNTPTTGTAPQIAAPAPSVEASSETTQSSSGTNETLTYKTTVARSLSISSTIRSGNGTQHVVWDQQLYYQSYNHFSSEGRIQYTSQNTTGVDHASIGPGYTNRYQYPLTVNSTFNVSPEGDISIDGSIGLGLEINIFGRPVFPTGIQSIHDIAPHRSSFNPAGAPPSDLVAANPVSTIPALNGVYLSTSLTGQASYFAAAKGTGSYGFGTTSQDFDFGGLQVKQPSADKEANFEIYSRHVKAVNASVVEDDQTFYGQAVVVPIVLGTSQGLKGGETRPGFLSVRAALGRGPGNETGHDVATN